ncbi:MinD/ParA family ATP-binding protein [Mycolicibacterium hassiacum]|uniref:MinD/ParA family ATP-binding protein n=1 Tax=Mycolicibacterium hassiacum TaxID=46351 RepID=UPI0022EC45EF|nr:MinD/ParA family protein [Mycolicibacterium hassiacum]MDA4088365.1 ATPase involved in chromosome partitioning family protein [Mycolicibacterium hassiacum DSM 44199]
MTDRDEELRRRLGWTGPEETETEPDEDDDFDTPPPKPAPRPSGPGDRRPSGDWRQPPPQYGPGRHGGVPWGAPPGPAGAPQQQPQQPPQAPPPGPQDQPTQVYAQVPGPPVSGPPASGPPAPGPQWGPPAPPPGSYAESIRADELVRPRRRPPTRGWRLVLYRATFGLVNLGPGPDELRLTELVAQVRAPLRGNYKIGVMGKGGVGKTTVSASVGSIFAELRQDDRVVAIDADTAFGKLGSRIDPKAPGSYWELIADQHLETFADVRTRVGKNAAGLFVLPGENAPARRRVLEPAIYREAAARLDRFFTISIIDCSSTMDSPVTQEVLRDLDALIVVSSPWIDGAAAAGQTMDWLAAHGMTELLSRTVIVLNDSDGHADKRTRSILAQQFSTHGQRVIEVPFDGSLRPGGVIDSTAQMSQATRIRFLEIAAALAAHFPATEERARTRRG